MPIRPASAQPPGRPDIGRRLALTAGLTTALGALGAASAAPASAAAGGSLVLGGRNWASTRTTKLSATTSGSVLWVVADRGVGLLTETWSADAWAGLGRNRSAVTAPVGRSGAVRGEGGANVGVYATTGSNRSWGAVAVNTGPASGSATGGALRVEGRRTTGLFVDTDEQVVDVPAVTALGGDGEFNGTALVAGGTSYLDGQALALRSFVGILGQSSTTRGRNVLQYAPVVSGEVGYHTVAETVALDGDGAATVRLDTDWSGTYAPFLRAVDLTTLRISLTAVGAAMPNLHALWTPSATATSFGIAGGTAGGTVHFSVTAKRVQVTLADVEDTAAGSGPAAGSAAVGGAGSSGPRLGSVGPGIGSGRVRRGAGTPRR